MPAAVVQGNKRNSTRPRRQSMASQSSRASQVLSPRDGSRARRNSTRSNASNAVPRTPRRRNSTKTANPPSKSVLSPVLEFFSPLSPITEFFSPSKATDAQVESLAARGRIASAASSATSYVSHAASAAQAQAAPVEKIPLDIKPSILPWPLMLIMAVTAAYVEYSYKAHWDANPGLMRGEIISTKDITGGQLDWIDLEWTLMHNYGSAFGSLRSLPRGAYAGIQCLSSLGLIVFCIYAWRVGPLMPLCEKLMSFTQWACPALLEGLVDPDWQTEPSSWTLQWAATWFLAGAACNVNDRLQFGYVIDYIDSIWTWFFLPEPCSMAFNWADCEIDIAMILLLYHVWRLQVAETKFLAEKEKKAGKEKKTK